MDRDEFMELVYETFADEPDNVLANGIIEAADAYAEHEKAQLSKEGTTSDLISRQAAIDAINSWRGRFSEEYNEAIDDCENSIKELPPAQPEPSIPLSWIENEIKWLKSLDNTFSEITALQISAMVNKWRDEKKMSELIDRQAAIDAIENSSKPYVWQGADIIRRLPTVQPEPHEGHWILHESPDGGEQYECSECGVLWEFNDGTPEDNEAYFCPKCGAKMRGEQHETD